MLLKTLLIIFFFFNGLGGYVGAFLVISKDMRGDSAVPLAEQVILDLRRSVSVGKGAEKEGPLCCWKNGAGRVEPNS